MRRINFLLLAVLFYQLAFSRLQVDTISVFSNKMKKELKAVVIVPENYSKKKHYPVVYVLHGFSGNYSNWVNNVPEIKTLSTGHQLIIVCPDGGYSSWYIDSPVDSVSQYESFITKDLLPYIDAHYATIPERTARAITGLSMGGHGALYLAIRNPHLFAHAGSMSGVIDLKTTTQKKELAKKIGSLEDYPGEWKRRSVINMVDKLKNKDLDLIIDCGVSDFFSVSNANLHRKLLSLKIDHDYIERPGEHNWAYWGNSIPYQILFFYRCFGRGKK